MQYTNTHDMSDSEMRKEIYRLRRELKAETRQIQELAKSDPMIPTSGVKAYKDFEKELKKGNSVKRQDTSDLRKTLRKLRYVNDLKTSHVRGAVESGKRFEPIRKTLQKATKEEQDKFWDMYKELYHEGSIYERFKYEVYEALDRALKTSELTPEELIKRITDLREELIRDYGGVINDEELDIYFTEELRELFK